MRTNRVSPVLVVDLAALDRDDVALAGGKAAHLGELMGIETITVPPGCCVTTASFRLALAESPALTTLPGAVATALDRELRRLCRDAGDSTRFAVRSSATVEDGLATSFAGMHDSFLGVPVDEVPSHVVRCWASLRSERAVAARCARGIDEDSVAMAVVVQVMVDATAAGVLFTADPVTGRRRVTRIEAVAGLAEALVAGRARPDVVTVRAGQVVERTPAPDGNAPVLTDEQARRLAAVGERIEAHLGWPQDVEWCLVDDDVRIVQSRPITALFPIPVVDDDAPHVYLSVGHQQMMTDAMRPLGRSLWQRLAMAPMHEAGGRLFVDVAPRLASSATRSALLELFGRSDPLMRDAMQVVIDRGDLLPAPPAPPAAAATPTPVGAPPPAPPRLPADPAVVAALIRENEASVAALDRALDGVTGGPLLDAVAADVSELRRVLTDPTSLQAIEAGMQATWWLDDHLTEWLGEPGLADALAQSAPGNVTSEMGLALLDVADAIRPHPEVVAFLRGVDDDDTFLDALADLRGGREARAAIEAYLDAYGARCVGEIDLTRPRWHERPSALVPAILADVDQFEPGESRRRFQRGLQHAAATERRVLERLRLQPDGEARAAQTKEMIDRLRRFIGYREYPKFGIVRRLAIWRRAIMGEARRLAAAGVIADPDDVGFLRFDELREAVHEQRVDPELIARRRTEHAVFEALAPPRVLTSDGEVITGTYRRQGAPPGALVGIPVSRGTVEGRARVVTDMSAAELQRGDVLVTAFTDPSWAPLFVAAAGLVTEVGGAMTHGSVIAREYGLPAVVGVDGATRRIRDGQRIRVHGSEGWVELLDG